MNISCNRIAGKRALVALTTAFATSTATLLPLPVQPLAAAVIGGSYVSVPDGAEKEAIYSPGVTDQPKTVNGRVYINRDRNNAISNDKPIELGIPGIPVYAYYESEGFRSPIFYTVTDATGYYSIAMPDFVGADGKTHDFIAAIGERLKVWADLSGSPYRLADNDALGKMQTFGTNRETGSWIAGSARDFHIAVQEIPVSSLHKPEDQWYDGGLGDRKDNYDSNLTSPYGRLQGTVFWNLNEPSGDPYHYSVGIPRKTAGDLPASGVKVIASYLNDTGKEVMDAWKKAHPDFTKDELAAQSRALVAEHPEYIAETIYTTTNASGDFSMNFKGIFNDRKDVVDEQMTIGNKTDGKLNGFGWRTLIKEFKHINRDYLYIQTDTPPEIGEYSDFNFAGYFDPGTVTRPPDKDQLWLSVTNSLGNIKMALSRGATNFDVTDYDAITNIAPPGVTVQTTASGFPPITDTTYTIKWYQQTVQDDGTLGEKTEVPGATCATITPQPDSSIPSCPVTVPKQFEGRVLYTAQLYSSQDPNDIIALDSFMAASYATDLPSRAIDADTPYAGSVNLPVPDGTTVTYALQPGTSLPRGLELDPATGAITGAPTIPGDYEFKIEATATKDGRSTITHIPGSITIVDTAASRDKDAPFPTDATTEHAVVGNDYSAPLVVTPEMGDRVRNFAINGNPPAGMTLSPEGVLAGTPTQPGEQPFSVTYEVQDRSGKWSKVTDTVPFAVVSTDTTKPVVTPTQVSTTAGEAIPMDAPITLATISDDQAAPLAKNNVQVSDNLPNGLSWDVQDGKIILTGTPTTPTDGPVNVTVTVTDDAGNKTEVTVPVTITQTDAAKYDASYPTSVSGKQGTTITTTPQITKTGETEATTDNPVKSYALGELPQGVTQEQVSINPATGEITFTPTANQEAKQYDFPVTVTYNDDTTDTTTASTTVTLSDANTYTPTGGTITVPQQSTPGATEAKQAITNAADLPADTKFEFVDTIDTSTPGAKQATVKVTYPDGTSETVPVTVKVADDATTFTPNPGTVTVGQNSEPGADEAKKAITNAADLPADTTFEFVGTVDTSTPGDKQATVKVTYPDGTSEEVQVTVKVTDEPQNTTYDVSYPAAVSGKQGTTITTTPQTTKTGETTATTDNPVKSYALGKLPQGVTQEQVSINPATGEITFTPTANQEAKQYDFPVTVTYNDDTTDTTTASTTVTLSDANTYTPTGGTITVPQQSTPGATEAKKAISNADQLPANTTFEFVGTIDTSTPGDKQATVKVTYPDGTSETVPVTVKVADDATTFTPNPGTVTVGQNSEPGADEAKKAITNAADLPADTKFEFVGDIDTSTPGDKTATVKVTYPDGTSEEV
ncbi:Rib/alpha-like domain-containing protein, partial [Corynebacterium choanae]